MTGRRRRAAGSGGFTMMEVMMAVVVLATAMSGIVAFQYALMRSNTTSNDLTAATFVGRWWLERGRLESQLWRTTTGTELDAATTPLLSVLGAANIGTANATTNWQWLPAGTDRTAAAVPLNRQLGTWSSSAPQASDYAEYCVQYRLTVLIPSEVLRMEVRVMWLKPNVSRSGLGTDWTCAAAAGLMLTGGDATTGVPNREAVDTLQVASTLWRNQVTL